MPVAVSDILENISSLNQNQVSCLSCLQSSPETYDPFEFDAIPTFFPTIITNSLWTEYASILDLNCHENETTMDNWIQVLLLSCHITIPCHMNNIGFISPPSWFWIEVSANTKPQPIPSSTVVVNSNSHTEYQLQAHIQR